MPVRPWPTALESSKAWQVPRARPLSGWLRERATQRLRERTPLMERGCEDSTPRVTVHTDGRSHRGVTGVNCKKRSYHNTRIPVSTTCTRSTSNIVAYAHRPPLVQGLKREHALFFSPLSKIRLRNETRRLATPLNAAAAQTHRTQTSHMLLPRATGGPGHSVLKRCDT